MKSAAHILPGRTRSFLRAIEIAASAGIVALLFWKIPPTLSGPLFDEPVSAAPGPAPETAALPEDETSPSAGPQPEAVGFPTHLTHYFFEHTEPAETGTPFPIQPLQSNRGLPTPRHNADSLGRDPGYAWKPTRLPEDFDKAILAKSGRLMVIRTKQTPRLYVYDVEAGDITGIIHLPTNDFEYTAGGNRALIYYPGPNLFQTYSLDDYRRIYSHPNTLGDKVFGMGMGSAKGDTAVLVVGDINGYRERRIQLLDLSTLQNIRGSEFIPSPNRPENGRIFYNEGQQKNHVACNQNLTLFAVWVGYPDNTLGFLRKGSTVLGLWQLKDPPNLEIFATARHIFQDIHHPLIRPPRSLHPHQHIVIPVNGTEMLLNLSTESETIQLISGSRMERIDPFGPFPLLNSRNEKQRTGVREAETRYHYHVPTGHFVYISSDLRHILRAHHPLSDLKSFQDNPGLLVVSDPIVTAISGQPFEHIIQRLPATDDVSFRLTQGPAGMQISPAGIITWEIPSLHWSREYEIKVEMIPEGHRPIVHEMVLVAEAISHQLSHPAHNRRPEPSEND